MDPPSIPSGKGIGAQIGRFLRDTLRFQARIAGQRDIACGKPADKSERLAESGFVRLRGCMEWDSALSNSVDIAAKITDLQTDELDRFFRDHLRRRDLHQVVANLNEAVLSKDNPRSESARKALKKLGFTD